MGTQYPLVIIGGGLSGLAAGIRAARFGHKVLILEKHRVAGGLNSYYYRRGRLFETGLHAMTNFAEPGDKQAPLNRLFRQLKLSRRHFVTHQQFRSRIIFPHHRELSFSNDINLLVDEISENFPLAVDSFRKLIVLVDEYDPFLPRPFISARARLAEILPDPLLTNMLLWPLMMYGCSTEHDMDFSQFVIMFRAIYLEGFFRPEGNIRNFLDALLDHYRSQGGEIRFSTGVDSFMMENDRVAGLRLTNGETIDCDFVVSTAGYPATMQFMGGKEAVDTEPYEGRMSFMECIYLLDDSFPAEKFAGDTILFYNLAEPFDYCRPEQAVNVDGGVICFSDHFQNLPSPDLLQLRITHPANHALWKSATGEEYAAMKSEWGQLSRQRLAKMIGNYEQNIVYEDSFTPLTIERFTGKRQGAVYGSPVKIKDGVTRLNNLFVAGTDQGYLGIVGAMLSGVTMVNKHILEKI